MIRTSVTEPAVVKRLTKPEVRTVREHTFETNVDMVVETGQSPVTRASAKTTPTHVLPKR